MSCAVVEVSSRLGICHTDNLQEEQMPPKIAFGEVGTSVLRRENQDFQLAVVWSA